MGTMTKTNFKHVAAPDTDFKESWKTQGGWLPKKRADPKTDDATAFYEEIKKPLKQSVNLAHKHSEL